ncbi:synphilin-1 [Scomber scombrus]|uniref:synphilin-1 n=1 Tax=Scomber scombrus TaxID=13677 RepID=UPI002DDBBEBB|nr:synphilin-1 [Scomber scombrus]
MEAPEYLDLDEIDFSDDSVYSVTSLKSIPELSRRSDGQAEERPAPAINWSRGVSSHSGGGIKPTGLAEVHSKFRPVKRVSPLKHQPETTDSDCDGKVQSQGEPGEDSKDDPKPTHASSSDGPGGKAKSSVGGGVGVVGGNNHQALFGELEHYDLDMDEILDVPYIKSSQQMSTLPRVPHDKRSVSGSNLSGGTLERNRGGGGLKSAALPHNEPLSLGSSSSQTPYCVLSPVKWSDLRKSKSMDPDLHLLHRSPAAGSYQAELHSSSSLLSCSSSLSSFSDADKLLSARVFPDSQSQRSVEPAGGAAMMFPLPGCRQDGSKTWTPGSGGGGGAGGGGSGGPRGFGGGGAGGGEMDEETKKNQNIINIVREGQISLLPHLAADNLELIRDEDGNNLLHISASQGHADCLQHLTSLMGEDSLNERNNQQLTPAGLGVKNGHLECVRWMVSETEAIAELSCSREHPSLIHYAGRHGQEKVLLWLLQFMQEQAISLDEIDQNGNTAVHVAAQYGHLTCIQTLVEYGSNVTVQNQQGERPSQSAERQGHTTCARYLVVVETCMSLASQVVKLTKQLNEQAAEKIVLQKQMQSLMDPKAEGTPSRSPSSHQPSVDAWPEMMLTAEGIPGDGHWLVRQGGVGPDTVLRQLLGKDAPEMLCPRERLPLAGGLSRDPGPAAPGPRRTGLVERRELKLARLKQIMQRSLSESDSDGYPPEEGKSQAAPPTNTLRPDRPSHLPITEEEPASNHLPLVMKKNLPPTSSSAAEKKQAFSASGSKSVDGGGYNPSPTSSDPDAADGKTPDASGDAHDAANGQKVATSPKSALKSPSSRRKTSQNLKLRVTFDEQVHKSSGQEAEPTTKVHHGKERTPTGSSESKRPFGAFRSIMETLSGNTNHSNNNSNSSNSQSGAAVKSSNCQNSPGKKSESKSSTGGAKGKNKSSNV